MLPEKTIRMQRWAILILLFIFGLGCWVNLLLGQFWVDQTLASLQPTPTSAPAPTPAVLQATTPTKQVIYEVDNFIDFNSNGVWDNEDSVYLVDFTLKITMTTPDSAFLAITAETPTGRGQIHVVKSYLNSVSVEPYATLPDDYQSPTVTIDKYVLCPEKGVKSQRVSTSTSVTAEGDLIITYQDIFLLPICSSDAPNL